MRDWMFVSTQEPMMFENQRRPLVSILREVSEEFGVTVHALRGLRRSARLAGARRQFYLRAMAERDDLSSSEVARAINRDGSTVRCAMMKTEAA
jgi:chromosomal replication initiation ATPase DnaA